MTLKDTKQEPFGFWIAREFLVEDETPEEEFISDRAILTVGSVLFLIIVLVGLFMRASS